MLAQIRYIQGKRGGALESLGKSQHISILLYGRYTTAWGLVRPRNPV